MIQKIRAGWKSGTSAVEAMSASMALAFLVIFLTGQSFSGLAHDGDPALNRVVWTILCAGGSLPFYVGWVWDIQRLRNVGLFCGAVFWALVTANFFLTPGEQVRGVTWGIYAAFVAWAYLNRRRAHGRSH